ncbi:MAG: hypothetical protein NTZ80_01165 [Patescibacteria group bacterium]|nr:hypothetical protein [Patescibacteria group bacterium]
MIYLLELELTISEIIKYVKYLVGILIVKLNFANSAWYAKIRVVKIFGSQFFVLYDRLFAGFVMVIAQKLLNNKTLTLAGIGNATSKVLVLLRLLKDIDKLDRDNKIKTIFYLVEEGMASDRVLEAMRFFHDIEIYQVPPKPSAESNGIEHRIYEMKIIQLGANLATCDQRRIIVLNENELLTPIQSKASFLKKYLSLGLGDQIGFSELFEKLLDSGYHPTELALVEPGTFLRKGSLIDIFPVNTNVSFRLELDDKQIVSIHSVDALTNEICDEFANIDIFPLNVPKNSRILDFMDESALLVIDELEMIDVGDGQAVQAHLEKNNVFILRFASFPDSDKDVEVLRFADVLRYSNPLDFTASIKKKKEQGWKVIVATRRPAEVRAILNDQRVVFEDGKVDDLAEIFLPNNF